ncbi:hypothetical protein BJ165DRAFT_1492991, partial [Panaeolus papilionaceus]
MEYAFHSQSWLQLLEKFGRVVASCTQVFCSSSCATYYFANSYLNLVSAACYLCSCSMHLQNLSSPQKNCTLSFQIFHGQYIVV